MFDKLAKYTALVSAFIVFMGVIRLIIYYRFFSVPILSYLEFSEIITSFLDIIVFTVFFILLGALITFLLSAKKNGAVQRNDTVSDNDTLWTATSTIAQKMFWLCLLILTTYAITFGLALFYAELALFSFGFGIFALSLVTFVVLYSLLIAASYLKRISSSSFIDGSLQFAGALYICLVCSYTILNVVTTKSQETRDIVLLTLKNGEKLTTRGHSYFIGKTQGYVFWRDDDIAYTRVLPIENVSEIIYVTR